jgi:hypothetical protein
MEDTESHQISFLLHDPRSDVVRCKMNSTCSLQGCYLGATYSNEWSSGPIVPSL